MFRRRLIPLLAAVVLLLLLPVAAQALTYDQAVDKLVAGGYPQSITTTVSQMGTSSLGFRWAGSPADNEAAKYIAAQMKLMGLSDVRLEKVPLDVWDFRGASVAVDGGGLHSTFTASGFAGARGTGAMPVTAPIVYVGSGTEAEFDAAGDVTGKIVLVDFDGYDWWSNFPQMLAGQRGAAAVVFTHAPDDFDILGEYFSGDNALGSFDAETDYSAPPLVYISRADGAALRAACQSGAVAATVKADIRVRLATNGGFGYNVVGAIPGTSDASQMVLLSAHHDAHFRGAEDDTSAVATALTMAKAMKLSGTRPAKTLVLLITTGEEFGTTNSWYDWLIGSYHAITKAHPDWSGRIAGQINLEWQGAKNAPLQVRSNPEMTTFTQSLLDSNAALLPYGVDNGGKVRANVWTWNDQWPFTAAGVPSVYFVTKDATYRGAWYHSQYDTMALIDWSYLAKNAKLYRKVQERLDKGVVPYDFTARALQFEGNFDATELAAAGAGSGPVQAVVNADARFVQASGAWEAGKGKVTPRSTSRVNARLMMAERTLNRGLTALDQWDGTTYPHVQLLDDVQELNEAIGLLEASPVDPDAAQAALSDVGPIFYGLSFGQTVYERQLERQRPDYYRVNWGGLGHLEVYPNAMVPYNLIGAGSYQSARDMLVMQRDKLLAQLDKALCDEAATFNCAAGAIEDVTPAAHQH